jgi:hypothetical protein
VKKIQWDPDRPFAEEVFISSLSLLFFLSVDEFICLLHSQIAARNEPVILKNTIVTKWRAFKLWKPNYLIKRVPYFRGFLL